MKMDVKWYIYGIKYRIYIKCNDKNHLNCLKYANENGCSGIYRLAVIIL